MPLASGLFLAVRICVKPFRVMVWVLQCYVLLESLDCVDSLLVLGNKHSITSRTI